MPVKENRLSKTRIGIQLRTNRLFQAGEIILVFAAAFLLLGWLKPLAGDRPVLKQIVVWATNILMLFLVWTGLKLRGESWKDLGLTFKFSSRADGLKVFLLSLLVFVIAVSGFLIGSIIGANISGIPQSTNLGGYNYLKDNIWMLLLTLGGVYLVSSMGEEIIYRAFLIKRISQFGLDTKKGVILAVILSSVVFGLVHYEWGPMGILQTGCMGIALGVSYILLKKRLLILILAHAYMDTLLMVQLYLAQ